MYIDCVLGNVGIQDRLVKLAVSFVVYERVGIKHTIVGALFGKAGKLTPDEKMGVSEKGRLHFEKGVG